MCSIKFFTVLGVIEVLNCMDSTTIILLTVAYSPLNCEYLSARLLILQCVFSVGGVWP